MKRWLSLSVATFGNRLKICFHFFSWPRERLKEMRLPFEGKYLSHLDAGSTHKAAPLCCWPLSCTTRAGGCLGSPLNGFSVVLFLRALTLCFAFFPGCACELMTGSFTSSTAPTAPPSPTFDVQNCFLQVLRGIFFFLFYFSSTFQIVCISSFETRKSSPPSEWSIFIVIEHVFDGDLLVVGAVNN